MNTEEKWNEYDKDIFRAIFKAGMERERKECWNEINGMIVHGELPGNGTDKQAERNGLVLASNAILYRNNI